MKLHLAVRSIVKAKWPFHALQRLRPRLQFRRTSCSSSIYCSAWLYSFIALYIWNNTRKVCEVNLYGEVHLFVQFYSIQFDFGEFATKCATSWLKSVPYRINRRQTCSYFSSVYICLVKRVLFGKGAVNFMLPKTTKSWQRRRLLQVYRRRNRYSQIKRKQKLWRLLSPKSTFEASLKYWSLLSITWSVCGSPLNVHPRIWKQR